MEVSARSPLETAIKTGSFPGTPGPTAAAPPNRNAPPETLQTRSKRYKRKETRWRGTKQAPACIALAGRFRDRATPEVTGHIENMSKGLFEDDNLGPTGDLIKWTDFLGYVLMFLNRYRVHKRAV